LNEVLRLDNRWHWLQFHALWLKRVIEPWQSAGSAVTMLDLATKPAPVEELLAHYPDVLLYAAKLSLIVGTKGIWIEGLCVTSYQAGTDLTAERVNGSFEIQIGSQRIRCAENPRPFLDQIKRWLRWYFLEFVPSVANTPRPLTESRHRMWQLNKIACPECGRPLVPCLGDLGVAVK
jgi:hypothetical protein